MNNIERVKMELTDRGFAQKIADRYTNLKLFSINFAPIISTKRFIPRMKWLELVYALPYLVLRREILNSFKKTKNVFTSVKQIWNIFVRFEFPLSRYEYITTRSHRFSREIMKMQDARYKMQIKPVSDLLYPVSSPSVNLVKDRDCYFAYPYTHLERETLQKGQKMISYFKSSSMELAQLASYETSKRETKKESPVKNYQLPVVSHQPPAVSHKPSGLSYEDPATYILTSTSDFITSLFSYYPFNPAFFLSQKTGQVKQREVPLNLQKSDAVYRPYGHIEKETLLNGQKISSQLNFKSSSMELAQPVSRETTRIEPEKELAFANYQLLVVTPQPMAVSHKPPAVGYKNQIPPSSSDFITPLFSYYPFNPTFFLSQKTVPIMQRGVSLIAQKSDAVYRPYGHLERETLESRQKITSYFKSSSMELTQPVSRETTRIEPEKEPAVKNTNYQLPVVTHQPPIVSHKLSAVSNKNPDPYTLTSTSDLITPLFRYYSTQKIKADMGEKAIYDSLPYFNFMNKQSHLNTSEVEKAPIYQTYPEIEHVASTHTEVMKEKVIEKGEESKPPHATPQLPSIDVNRLADQVYSFIERKLKIERERRGLYG